MNFYTNCTSGGNFVYYRGWKDGVKIKEKIRYKPNLFVKSPKQSKFKTLDGSNVSKIEFEDISACRSFMDEYKDVDNFQLYGNSSFNACHVTSLFPDEIQYDKNKLIIAYLDIETESENGFPDPAIAQEPILAITVKVKSKYYVFCYGDYKVHRDDIVLFNMDSETEMLDKFLTFWNKLEPDIISGYNSSGFDIPYIYNRIKREFGEKSAKKLSPWGYISERKVTIFGKQKSIYNFSGIASIDYMDLFKKYAKNGKQESYKLDYIAHVVLGTGKIDYSEQGSLRNLYKNDYQKFIEYNINDVKLLQDIDDKLKLMDVVISLAYKAKVNFDDIFGPVRMWDTLIFNYCRKNDIVIPFKRDNEKDEKFRGAFVFDPICGLHNWAVCYDVASLYPNLIRTLNISPETLVEDWTRKIDIDECVENGFRDDLEYSLAANGHSYKKDKIGFLPDMLGTMFKERQVIKGKQLDAERELELVKKEMMNRGIL